MKLSLFLVAILTTLEHFTPRGQMVSATQVTQSETPAYSAAQTAVDAELESGKTHVTTHHPNSNGGRVMVISSSSKKKEKKQSSTVKLSKRDVKRIVEQLKKEQLVTREEDTNKIVDEVGKGLQKELANKLVPPPPTPPVPQVTPPPPPQKSEAEKAAEMIKSNEKSVKMQKERERLGKEANDILNDIYNEKNYAEIPTKVIEIRKRISQMLEAN